FCPTLLLLALKRLHPCSIGGGLLLLFLLAHSAVRLGFGALILIFFLFLILLVLIQFLGLGLKRFVAGDETLLFHAGDHLAGVFGFIDCFFLADLAGVEVHPQVVVEQLHAIALAGLNVGVAAAALVFAAQVLNRRGDVHEFIGRDHAIGVGSRTEGLGEHGNQVAGKLHADLFLLIGGEGVDNSVDC